MSEEEGEEIQTKINEAIFEERKTIPLRQKIEIENARKKSQKEIEVLSCFWFRKLIIDLIDSSEIFD